jgi:hypothetical protein
MALSSDFQTTRGTVLATFTQTGTYSAPIDLGGGWLVGAYSDNWPGVAGSITVRSSWTPAGTGYPVQTVDGTILRILNSGSGTFNSLGHAPWNTAPLQYVTLQVGTGGTASIAAGGTVVLVTGV